MRLDPQRADRQEGAHLKEARTMKRLTLSAALAALTLAAACATPNFTLATVTPAAETQPMPSIEDAADDPAIWLWPARPGEALVLGTDKQTGVYVFDMKGNRVQALPLGRVNNVDVRTDPTGGAYDYAVASNDERNVVSVFVINRVTGELDLLDEFPTGKVEPYGICLGAEPKGFLTAVTYKDGTTQVFAFAPAADPSLLRVKGSGGEKTKVSPTLVRTVQNATKLEGCVFDEYWNRLYIGEEETGIWSLDLTDPASTPQSVDRIADGHGLAADVEGLTLWRGRDGTGWLIASAQGKDRYVVYDRAPPNAPRGVFAITDLKGEDGGVIIDATTTTDGIDAVSAQILPGYPRGLLVVQDDVNTAPDATQDFKYVDWSVVEDALALPRLVALQGTETLGGKK